MSDSNVHEPTDAEQSPVIPEKKSKTLKFDKEKVAFDSESDKSSELELDPMPEKENYKF